jgi:ribonuclease HI
LHDYQKAEALRLLAKEMDLDRAMELTPRISPAQWRSLLHEAASFFEERETARPDEPSSGQEEPASGPRVSSGQRPVLMTDGASRGNPGPAAAGAIVLLGDEVMGRISQPLGIKTNNQAEYEALLLGLDLVRRMGFKEVSIRSDSQLLVRQLQGRYKVRDSKLKPLFQQAVAALKALSGHDIVHIGRELNQEADALANQALDRGRD